MDIEIQELTILAHTLFVRLLQINFCNFQKAMEMI